MVASFLDIKRAYDDTVDRCKLWALILEFELHKWWIEFFEEMYDKSYIFSTKNGEVSEKFRLKKGLRQGCPCSVTLFLIHIEKVSRRVYETGLGLRLTSTSNTLEMRPSVILSYADDMVLLAEDTYELQQMLDVSGTTAEELRQFFNEKKCANVVFAGNTGNESKLPI